MNRNGREKESTRGEIKGMKEKKVCARGDGSRYETMRGSKRRWITMEESRKDGVNTTAEYKGWRRYVGGLEDSWVHVGVVAE